MTLKTMEISEATAKFFRSQCIGQHEGHMSMIPNNPVIRSLCLAHGKSYSGMTDCEFVEFLRGIADQLDRNDF